MQTPVTPRYKYLPPEVHLIIIDLIDSPKDRYNLKRVNRDFFSVSKLRMPSDYFRICKEDEAEAHRFLIQLQKYGMLADCLRPCRECCRFLHNQRFAHESLSSLALARYTCITCGMKPKVNLYTLLSSSEKREIEFRSTRIVDDAFRHFICSSCASLRRHHEPIQIARLYEMGRATIRNHNVPYYAERAYDCNRCHIISQSRCSCPGKLVGSGTEVIYAETARVKSYQWDYKDRTRCVSPRRICKQNNVVIMCTRLDI